MVVHPGTPNLESDRLPKSTIRLSLPIPVFELEDFPVVLSSPVGSYHIERNSFDRAIGRASLYFYKFKTLTQQGFGVLKVLKNTNRLGIPSGWLSSTGHACVVFTIGHLK